MRIANNSPAGRPFKSLMAVALCAFGVYVCAPACAQQAAAVVVPAAPPGSSPVVAPVGSTQVAGVPVGSSSAAPAAAKETIEKSMVKIEEKLIENAKAEVKKLDNASEETTISELNRIRQTISRIEAMIDVEKRLSELEKVRNDRNKNAVASAAGVPANLAEAIPASALALPRSGSRVANVPSSENRSGEARVVEQRSAPRGRPVLQRVAGASGKYTALLKMGDETKSLKLGDKVSDGEYVRSITSSSVEIGGKGPAYTLRVKNVESVHGIAR